MPWHKVRVYYDREAERQRRFAYRVKLSVLLAAALLVLVTCIGIFPFVDLWFAPAAHNLGGVSVWSSRDIPEFPTTTQEICAVVALLCLGYVSIALNARNR